MNIAEPFDPLLGFTRDRTAGFKDLLSLLASFLAHPVLRDFWWEMAREEEQHACILTAGKAFDYKLRGRDLRSDD